MRIEAGAIVEEYDLPGRSLLVARFRREADGWVADYTVVSAVVPDLTVVKRVHAPSLTAARSAVLEGGRVLAQLRPEPLRAVPDDDEDQAPARR